jgi:hypothetical protein
MFYVYSLKLVAALCHGRNSATRSLVLKSSTALGLGLGCDELAKAVGSQALPYALRAAMLELMVALYVDVDPFQVRGGASACRAQRLGRGSGRPRPPLALGHPRTRRSTRPQTKQFAALWPASAAAVVGLKVWTVFTPGAPRHSPPAATQPPTN